MARRKLRTKTNTNPVEYADAEPSAFAAMLGGLIEANVNSRADRKKDFDSLVARVGIWVTDIDEGVTLDFRKGSLVVYNGLQAKRDLTIRPQAGPVMNLSTLKIALLRMRTYYDDVGQSVRMQLL